MSSNSSGVGREEKDNEKRLVRKKEREVKKGRKKTTEKSVEHIRGLTMGEKKREKKQKKWREKK